MKILQLLKYGVFYLLLFILFLLQKDLWFSTKSIIANIHIKNYIMQNNYKYELLYQKQQNLAKYLSKLQHNSDVKNHLMRSQLNAIHNNEQYYQFNF